ncbi:MAG: AzlC family ABC transporter permease [Methanobrevibacter sp.]|uniref:AzlC family ABC transporter permease n=1 Tax=Methanobrevibacter sp. TaxID=66852 RepID=UPI0026DFA1AD|nr:AzlC family ABC transporter permease [Methanobrevibacter sp.]MDO5849028.1 AzlC family ABC transporter permease [Methanobrevibacter sp.]
MRKTAVKEAFKTSIPIMAGYLLLGIGFGVLLRDAGYGVLWAFAMSVLIYAGALQYVGVGLIAGGAGIINIIITSFAVNARHLFYSISMIKEYRGAGKKKAYLAFALTDETYSLLCDGHYPEGTNKHEYRFFLSMFNQCYWIVGGIIGNLLGEILPFNSSGIEFSMTAIFVAAFVSQWKATDNHIPAIIGIACSVVCLIIFGSEGFLIPAMLMITFALLLFREKLENVGGEVCE